MKLRTKVLIAIMATAGVLAYSLSYSQQNKYKLKIGATGKLCLDCHDKFQEKLKSKFVHTPVKNGECSECHNPHTTSHSKLLYEDSNKACFKCHEDIVPKHAKSAHKIAVEGNCVKCHDPHGSNNKNNLLKAGNELCFSCHKNLGDTITKDKFKHNPVEKGCLNCHEPHGSEKATHLLKNDLVTLCGECHRFEDAVFVKQHVNYPVAKSNCSSCHDVHGSNKGGILFDNVHAPVANRMCNQCHEAANSATPFKTKRDSYELCRGCHSNMMNETFGKNRIHWPLVDKVGCLNCHEPHASTQKKLLLVDTKALCGKCHPDTMERQEKYAEMERQDKIALAASKGKQEEKGAIAHQPVMEGNCLTCHAAHSSDTTFLMKNPVQAELCGTCHEWLKHSSHPIGEKAIDSRNKNLTVQCLSCHRSHGTGYRHMNPFPTISELCVQCHKKYKR